MRLGAALHASGTGDRGLPTRSAGALEAWQAFPGGRGRLLRLPSVEAAQRMRQAWVRRAKPRVSSTYRTRTPVAV